MSPFAAMQQKVSVCSQLSLQSLNDIIRSEVYVVVNNYGFAGFIIGSGLTFEEGGNSVDAVMTGD